MRVLFVCLGNICRSPLAEIIVRAEAEQRGMARWLMLASAGTGDWHIGHGADQRSIAIARKYQLDLSAHRARQITGDDIANWDWFVAMDRSNRHDLLDMGAPADRVLLMRQFESEDEQDVPDPYYGGPEGFDQAYHMLRDNAGRILDFLARQGR